MVGVLRASGCNVVLPIPPVVPSHVFAFNGRFGSPRLMHFVNFRVPPGGEPYPAAISVQRRMGPFTDNQWDVPFPVSLCGSTPRPILNTARAIYIGPLTGTGLHRVPVWTRVQAGSILYIVGGAGLGIGLWFFYGTRCGPMGGGTKGVVSTPVCRGLHTPLSFCSTTPGGGR